MENNTKKHAEKKAYVKPEVKKLGRLNEIIRGSGSCGRLDVGEEKTSRIVCQ